MATRAWFLAAALSRVTPPEKKEQFLSIHAEYTNKCFVISKTGKQRVHFYALPISICSTASSTVTSGLETVFMNGYRLHTTTLEKGQTKENLFILKNFQTLEYKNELRALTF